MWHGLVDHLIGWWLAYGLVEKLVDKAEEKSSAQREKMKRQRLLCMYEYGELTDIFMTLMRGRRQLLDVESPMQPDENFLCLSMTTLRNIAGISKRHSGPDV